MVGVAAPEAGFCTLTFFFRADSEPLASDRLGDPGLLSTLRRGSLCFGRPDGVFDPLVEISEPVLSCTTAADLPLSAASFSSSFFASSAFWRSTSLSSDSLYIFVSFDFVCALAAIPYL